MTYKKKVILSTQSPSTWRYWDFVSANGSNPIQTWYDDLPEDIQDIFDTMLKNNQKTERPDQWIGFRKKLHGGDLKRLGVWQLELKGEDRRAHRLLGVFDGPKTAVFLIGYYHKGDNYTPPGALETAAKRARFLAQNRATRHERTVKTNI